MDKRGACRRPRREKRRLGLGWRDDSQPRRPPAPDWATADRELCAPAIAAQPGFWQPLPGWARRHGDDAGPSSEAAFAAGAALLALDQIVRAEPPWLGALRQRQALAAATVSSRLMRLPADEAALRDAHHLTRAGDDPGPAGRLHRAWRGLAARPARAEAAAGLAQALGLGATAGAELRPGPASGSPVARAAASAARAAAAVGPAQALEGEIFGLMLADLVLAETLGWPVPVPLLATTILGPALTGTAAAAPPAPGRSRLGRGLPGRLRRRRRPRAPARPRARPPRRAPVRARRYAA